jgi:hypothetical protein
MIAATVALGFHRLSMGKDYGAGGTEISQLSCQVLIQETGVCKLTQINWRNASACH